MSRSDLEAVARTIGDALSGAPPEDEDSRERFEAVRAAAERLEQILARTPWELVPPAWMDSAQAAFNGAAAAAQSYAEAEQATAFPTTWEEVQGLWGALLPFTVAIPPADAVTEDAASFRRSTGQLLRRLTEEVDAVRTQVAVLQDSLETVAAERDAVLAQAEQRQQELQATTEQRQAELRATISEQAARLDSAIRENQSQFAAAQETYRNEFSSMLRDQGEELKSLVAEKQGTVEQAVEEISQEASERLAAIEALEEKATESYNAIGTASIAGHYQNDANAQAGQANVWRRIAVAALVLVVVAVIVEFFAVRKGSFTVETTLSRLPVAIALAGLATYAIRESTRHRKAERWAREREVEISSIDPYLVLIRDEGKRDEIKAGFARRIFMEEHTAQAELHDEEKERVRPDDVR